MTRDELGRVVREAWWQIAVRDGNPANSWFLPYDEMDEEEREFCRDIGEAVAKAVLAEEDRRDIKAASTSTPTETMPSSVFHRAIGLDEDETS